MRLHCRQVVTGLVAMAAVPLLAQEPTFRSGVDLIAVDVQVVDNSGTPISGLIPDSFSVFISGKPRRVVSADFIRSTELSTTAFGEPLAARAVASNQWPTSQDPRAGRLYILAFDIGSLNVGDSRAMVGSALRFIDRLLPTDRVGVYTFPVGARIEPTSDHGAVRRKLLTIVGSPHTVNGRFNLSPSEVIDINAESTRLAALNVSRTNAPTQNDDETAVLRSVQVRECGGELSCLGDIVAEAQTLALYLEDRAIDGLNGIRSLIGVLGGFPERKTVVMFSGGIPANDRPGGRPDLGDMPKILGQDAAATNTAIYTLHVDTSGLRAMSAETRKAVSANAKSRDYVVGSRALEEFSGASGGALMRVTTGSGEFALERVLRETSSHYLLGVVPEDTDRNGKLRQLKVKVNRSGVTVRSRLWVVVPKKNL